MKNLFVALVGLFFIGLVFSGCSGMYENTKKHSPEGMAEIEEGDQKIKLTYSRPYKKERLIFGEKSEDALVPFGKKWRTGANEATEISFAKPANIQGKELPAGTYSLYTVPGPKTWIIAFNSRTDYWGATLGSPFKERKDVLRAEVAAEEMSSVEEQLLIELKKVENKMNLVISWDKTRVMLPIN